MIKLGLFLIFIIESVRPDCVINLMQLIRPPMVLSSIDYSFLYPPITNLPDDRDITIAPGETIIIACPGGSLTTNLNTTSRTILATCNQHSNFEVLNTILDFTTISCTTYAPMTVRVPDKKCTPNAILLHIGFQVGTDITYIPLITICFDTVQKTPLYSQYNITKSIGFIKSYLVTPFEDDHSFYNLDVNIGDLYDMDYQKSTINSLLGLPANSSKFIQPETCATTPGFCLKVGELAYRGDFVYILQQWATYRYIQTAPIWSFVQYNWSRLERNVIDYIRTNLRDLQVYTGVYGVATLPHEDTGSDTELFLMKSVIPIPQLLWKLVYEPISKRASVFITVNNPWILKPEIDIICQDMSENIAWLTWERENATKGFSYVCTYEDAKSTITYLPEILVDSLLV